MEWIDASKLLPEKEKDVLVFGIRHGSVYYDIAGLFYGDWMSQITEESCKINPTHWMPLPEPPQE